MTSFSESDINRAADGRFAPKTTGESATTLDGEVGEREVIDSIHALNDGESVAFHHSSLARDLTVRRDGDAFVASMDQHMHIESTSTELADVQRFVRNQWGEVRRPSITTDPDGSYHVEASVDFPISNDPQDFDEIASNIYRSGRYEPFGSRSASQLEQFVESQDAVVAQARSHSSGNTIGMDDAVRDWAARYANQNVARRASRGFAAAYNGSTSEGLNPMEKAVFNQVWGEAAKRNTERRHF